MSSPSIEPRTESTDPRIVRKFGGAALVFFGILCAVALWRDHPWLAAFFGTIGTVLGLFPLALPVRATPLYERWTATARRIGRFNTRVILSLVYYLAITPGALFLKLLRRDPLHRKWDAQADSYWVPRAKPAQDPDRFHRMF